VENDKRWTGLVFDKNGMLDDSDVFAIEIDKASPDHVIASACSGIYETRTAGQLWKKVNGIPFSARRTRDITQNPANRISSTPARPKGCGVRLTRRFLDADHLKANCRQLYCNQSYQSKSSRSGTDDAGIMISEDGGEEFWHFKRGIH